MNFVHNLLSRRSLCDLELILRLKVHPEFGCCIKRKTQTARGISGDAPLSRGDISKVHAGKLFDANTS